MELFAKLFGTVALTGVILSLLYAVGISCHLLIALWSHGLDFHRTKERILPKKIGWLVLKDQGAAYLNGRIVGYVPNPPGLGDEGLWMFADIWTDDEIERLRAMKPGDIIEYRNKRYEIVSLSGPSTGNMGTRIVQMNRSSVRCRLVK